MTFDIEGTDIDRIPFSYAATGKSLGRKLADTLAPVLKVKGLQ